MVRGRRYWALAVTLWLTLGHTDAADAQRSYPVRIDSSPTGATVYVGSKDSDPIGQTPYRGQLDAGRHTIILELDGYSVHVQDIRVKRGRRMQRFRMELEELAEGQLEIIAAAGADKVDGARVFVDGEDVGNLPDIITVEAGPHQVQVKKEGYEPFEDWVEVNEGETTEIEVSLVRIPGQGPELRVGEPAKDEEQPLIEDKAPEHPAADRAIPFVALGAGVEVGGRQFRYTNATMGNLRPYDAGGVPLLRISGELTPLAMSQNPLLNGWSFTGAYAMAAPLNSSAIINEGQPDQATVDVPTTWTELDVGVGYNYRFAKQASYVGVRAGYGIHTYTFTYDDQSMDLQGTIPDVQYKFVSVGLEGRFAFARRFAFLLGGDTRLVSDTGDIGTRFKRSDVVALGARGGLAVAISKRFEGRLMGRYDSYSHTFTPQDAPMFVAEGGTDRYFVGTLTLSFLY